MRISALIALAVAAAIGLAVFALRAPGIREAEAKCVEEAPRCLPPVEMIDTAGTSHTPVSLAGKVVVVNFWATWCTPCKDEIPDLAELQRELTGEEFALLGLLTDAPSSEKLEAFSEEHGLNYPVVYAGPDLLDAFQFGGQLPVTYLYDRAGHRRRTFVGQVRHSVLVKEVRALLAEPAP